MVQLAGSIVSLSGSIFLFLGALGVLRMPDTYNRIQAGTKATTLGSILTLLGVGIYHVQWMPQMLILIGFIMITNPISSHTLARAAHFSGVPLTEGSVIDRLKEKETENQDVYGHRNGDGQEQSIRDSSSVEPEGTGKRKTAFPKAPSENKEAPARESNSAIEHDRHEKTEEE